MMKINGGLYGAAAYQRASLLKLMLVAIAVILIAACGGQGADGGQSELTGRNAADVAGTEPVGPEITPEPEDSASASASSRDVYAFGYTYGKASGNRYLPGTGDLETMPLRIDISARIQTPAWLNAAIHPEGGVVWVVTGTDGQSVAFRIEQDGTSTDIPIDYSSGNFSLVPPVLIVENNGQIGLTTTREAGGLATLMLDKPNDVRVEFTEETLKISSGDVIKKYPLQNAPDSTFMIGSNATVYSYDDATDRYPHGAIGDKNEWGGISAVPVGYDNDWDGHLLLDDDEVFEGLFPIIADIDEDGVEEIIGTVSTASRGARLIVIEVESTGMRIAAESKPIGSGFRWTHQIAVAPFGPNGEIELVSIRTPHIGGVAEYFRLTDGKLERVASIAKGYSSHINGSRNLDMAVAGDFDGDGNVELIVPSRGRRSLVALRRIGDSVSEVWEFPLGSSLVTNLAGIQLTDDVDSRIGFGAVTKDGVLFIWK